MSLPHAILGLLNIYPMTGYDLKHRAFDQIVSHFWQADQAQIYRTLTSMEETGWVTSSITVQIDRPSKRTYAITDAGRAELINWLCQPQPPPVYREPFLVQLFFAAQLKDEEILKHIEAHISAHQAKLSQYEVLAQFQNAPVNRDRMFWEMTLELGTALEHTYLDWLEKCRKKLLQNTDDSAEPSG